MKNILVAGDLHISQDSLEECKAILEEQKQLIRTYDVDTYISTGDNFDTIKPTSQELDLFSSFLKEINIPSIIIAAQSHESTSEDDSVLNHFGLLNDRIQIVKEFKDANKLYIGHFIVAESKLNKFGATVSKEALKNYFIAILGHGHNFELMPPNIMQLGSSRFVSFDEAILKYKMAALIQNYDTKPMVQEIALKSPIPMKDIVLDDKKTQNSQIQGSTDTEKGKIIDSGRAKSSNLSVEIASVEALGAYLDRLPTKNKVRVCFRNYAMWREFLNVSEKYKEKFSLFKEKKDFIMNSSLVISKQENLLLKDALIEWMQKNNVEEKIRGILLEEVQ
jgi:DNA repair exonuclease SbcCD nuclease subunit